MKRVFETRCKGCGRILVTVERLRDPEIAVITDHLRLCATSDPLGKAPALGEIMKSLKIVALKVRTEPSA
jgi:hypothetical protein